MSVAETSCWLWDDSVNSSDLGGRSEEILARVQ